MFQFRHFDVEDDQSTMKVGTDAMILGAWTTPPPSGEILEIGTGCGVISLMLAQRTTAMITAIDIHNPSVMQAEWNFRKSPWEKRLLAIHSSLRDFSNENDKKFDLVVSNPPFFTGSMLSSEEKRNISRHATDLSFEELADSASHLLKGDGRLVLILPYYEATTFIRIASSGGLKAIKQVSVFSRENDMKAVRMILEFSFSGDSMPEEKIFIRDANGSFSSQYLELTKEYHRFAD